MSVSNEEREIYIVEWLNKYEMPILKRCCTVEGITKALNEGELGSAFIRIEVKKFIIPYLIMGTKKFDDKEISSTRNYI